MRVRGDNAPSNAFTLEAQPNKPGFVLARFFENPEEFTEQEGDLTIHGWSYDEYHLELEDRPGLEEDIIGSFDGFLAQAKLKEAQEKTIPDLQQKAADLATHNAALTEKVELLEGQVTDAQMALCDVYEQVLLGGEV